MKDLPINQIIWGDCLEVMKGWPEKSIQCCITSPPYWGLRDYGVEGQFGLEKTPEEYVAKMVEVFREVKRVLRDDGTLWLNLGDSLADKQLQGIPWKVAFAIQADGWYLRQDIIWHKPNPMPESCTDRCTKAHEYIFLLTKKPRYFYDAEAITEPAMLQHAGRYKYDFWPKETKEHCGGGRPNNASNTSGSKEYSGTRNKRSIWTIPTKSFKEAHFATFPPKLIEPCILAGTSQKGACPECGGPWERVVEKRNVPDGKRPHGVHYESDRGDSYQLDKQLTISKTTGWRPTCECTFEVQAVPGDGTGIPTPCPVPCVVFDPFMGAGTVAVVSAKLKRAYVGIELNPEYVAMAQRRCEAVDTGVPVKETRNGQMAMFAGG